MAAETVVLDSSNLSAIIEDATGEPLEEAKPDTKVEAKPDAKPAQKAPEKDADGLTDDERKTYTEKMRKSVAWRHGKMREAQELAAQERHARIAAEERAKAAAEELERVRVQPKAQEAPKEPQPGDFQTSEAYMAARVRWEVSQELAREREERRKADEAAERDKILTAARGRISKALELVPDFAEVTGSVDLAVPAHIAAYMQEAELFPELGYFFAQHPDELERLAKMRPEHSLVALGKIESTLQPFADLVRAPAKAEPNGGSPKPSADADGIPSKPRVSVPVIQPLIARGAPEVETPDRSGSVRQAVSSFEKRTGASLTRRQRH